MKNSKSDLMISDGEISFKDAQNEIANNSVEAYNKHILEEDCQPIRGNVE